MSSTQEQRWSGQAFGLSIWSDFRLPGFRTGRESDPSERRLAIECLPATTLSEERVGERVCEWRDDHGHITLAIDETHAGFRFIVARVGVYELSADGQRIVCQPALSAGYEWRRYLIGQVLPFAALLQGLEVFHASAVEIDGRAVAISGPSGLGKSALALGLHLSGAGFVTDDVLALEVRDDAVVAHPGIAMAKVRRTTAHGLLEVRRPVVPVAEPLPLEAFCLLRVSGDGLLHVTEAPAEAREFLGATFNLVVTSAERLHAQLDVCAAVAEQARTLHVAVPHTIDGQVSGQLRAQLGTVPVGR